MHRESSSIPTVLGFVGPAGDHNEHPLTAVPELLDAVATTTGRPAKLFGRPFRAVERSSAEHLADARPALREYADAVDDQLSAGHHVVCVNGRCATSVATLPRVLRAHPDCVVVWLDAHADLNVPGGSPTDYLGGMAVSGPLGWWDSGFGGGLDPDRLLLVGTRSVDDAEAELIDRHRISVLPPGEATADAVLERVAGRPVYFHLDCDVLEPGIVRTDYRERAGLTLQTLADLADALAGASTVVGTEIAEWEGPGTADATDLVNALRPVLSA